MKIFMKHSFFVIGGDLRSYKLVEMLSEDENKVFCFGLESLKEIDENFSIEKVHSVKEGIDKCEIVVAPIPFSKNGIEVFAPFSSKKILVQDLLRLNKNKIFVGGSIAEKIKKDLDEKYKMVYDLMRREELTILNTIATAEGTIEVAIQNTDEILQGARVLVLGFGRVAKIVANKFCMNSCLVSCAARKTTDLAWIQAYGYKAININDMVYDLKNFDIIINTVPQKILGLNELKHVSKDVLLIDLASSPGGIDGNIAKNMGLKFVWALALPGKIAPKTSAKFIKQSIYTILSDLSKDVE